MINIGSTPTFWRNSASSIVHVTFASDSLMEQIKTWRVSDLYTYNNHHVILFEIAELIGGPIENLGPGIGGMRNHSIETSFQPCLSKRLAAG